eukprot:6196736-Pleurochrysis_carterae.AAC.1
MFTEMRNSMRRTAASCYAEMQQKGFSFYISSFFWHFAEPPPRTSSCLTNQHLHTAPCLPRSLSKNDKGFIFPSREQPAHLARQWPSASLDESAMTYGAACSSSDASARYRRGAISLANPAEAKADLLCGDER